MGQRVNSCGHIKAVGDPHVFPGFLTIAPTQLSFQSHRLLFSHVSAETRGKNRPERNFASTKYQTYNHQFMSPTRSPLSHPCRLLNLRKKAFENTEGKRKYCVSAFAPFSTMSSTFPMTASDFFCLVFPTAFNLDYHYLLAKKENNFMKIYITVGMPEYLDG